MKAKGFEVISGITNMSQMFTSRPSLETIWANGFELSVTSDRLMFSGRAALATIWTDAGWALPTETSGMQAFYQRS